MFFDKLEKYRHHIALQDDQGRAVTYDGLAEKCDLLNACKEGKRNLVLCLCKNQIDAVIGYISCLRNRDVPILLNVETDRELRENLIRIYRPQYLYVPKELAGEYKQLHVCGESQTYVLLETGAEREKMAEELALLLATSGSTGSPKLVRQSYQNIQSNAASIAEYLKLDENERPVTTLPMNYTYGLSIINSHLLVGAEILMTEHSLMQREFWDFFRSAKATSFGGVPYTYEILKKLKFFSMNLPNLKTMTQAGGKLRPDLHREFAEYAEREKKNFVVMYGQTEATARMAYLPADMSLEKYGSMGIAIPGGRLWLKDEQGNEITEPDTVGELVYEGDNVALGYAEQRTDLDREDEWKGVLETGDMARFDYDGFFYIVGRKKRFLKLFGNRVNLDETEQLIKTEFDYDEVVCAGKDDRLFIFVLRDCPVRGEKILEFISKKTKLHQSAFSVVEIEEIPKNDSGKIIYKKLERYYDGI